MKLEKNNINNEGKVESTKGYYYKKPLCDIYETDNNYKILFDIPGVDKKDINIKVEKDVLTLKADFDKEPAESYECIKKEIIYSGYKRSFDLNNSVDTNNIDANYDAGTLVLTLSKKEEQKTKEIKININ